MSKLAQLAKQRALAAKGEPNPALNRGASKLAALAKARHAGAGAGSVDDSSASKSTPLSKLQSLRAKRALELPESLRSATPEAPATPEPAETPQAPPSPLPAPTELPPQEVATDNSLLLDHCPHVVIGRTSKRRRVESSTNVPITNHELSTEKMKKVQQNFEKPLPDDVVLQAQSQAFDQMSQLLIKEKQAKTKGPKTTKPFKQIDLHKELALEKYAKPHRLFVVIGHVDAGKLTLMGRLLYDYGIVDSRTVNKLVKDAERAGKGLFALAWIMDQSSEERSHGVTIDICATDFETDTTKFTAIDAPGHRDFVPQMIGGVSQAELALLVVDSITGAFEAGFALDGQTKEHAILAKNLGIDHVCVAVNKMDKEQWSESRFDSMRTQLTEYLCSEEVGFTPKQINFIPILGLTGANVVKRGDEPALDWYKGPTLGEFLESATRAERNPDDLLTQDFYMSIHDSQRDKGMIKASGKVSLGIIQAGETIVALPSDESLQIQSLKVGGKPVDFAMEGELTEMTFKASQLDNDATEALRVGDLVTKPGTAARSVAKLQVSLHLFNLTKPLLVGQPFVLFRNNSHVPARISEIVLIDGVAKKKKRHLVSMQNAVVEIAIQEGTLPVTKYSDNHILGRVVIRRDGTTIGAGQVVELE